MFPGIKYLMLDRLAASPNQRTENGEIFFRVADFGMKAWNHLRAILMLPGIVTVVIPATILAWSGLDTFDWWRSVPPSEFVLPVLGLLMIASGLSLMVATIRLFVTVGEGTLAPWNPTQRLVVRGIYRHVRNPMITGVCCVLLGEAILAASAPLLCWFLLFWIGNFLYTPLTEEPGLVQRFGEEYLAYHRNVPRWIPRRTSWEGNGDRLDS